MTQCLTTEPHNQIVFWAHTLTALCRIDCSRVTVTIRRSGRRVLELLTREGAVERSGTI